MALVGDKNSFVCDTFLLCVFLMYGGLSFLDTQLINATEYLHLGEKGAGQVNTVHSVTWMKQEGAMKQGEKTEEKLYTGSIQCIHPFNFVLVQWESRSQDDSVIPR